MGRPAIDLLLRGFFEYCIHDLRKNLWLLNDIFGDAVCDPLTRVEHGEKEPRNAADWFINNKIEVVMFMRNDRPKFPCISIALGTSSEHTPSATLGDQNPLALGDIDPSEFGVNLDKIIEDFTPIAYNTETGMITLPDNLDTYQIAPSYHMVVEEETGRSFQIKKVLDDKNFMIAPNQDIDLKNIYIIPMDRAWVSYRERTRMMDSYEIGVHTTSDPVECIWLSQLVEYCLLKYKSKFLDLRNIQLSTFSISNVSKNENYTADKVFSRFFNLNFQVETDWIRSVAPKIARVQGGLIIIDGPKSPEELSEYIKKQFWKMEGDK